MITQQAPIRRSGSKRQKFKESCRQCAFTKVKCGKEKPTCARCQARTLRCIYEPSHRAGRRPAATRVLSADQVNTSTRPTLVAPSPRAASSDHCDDFISEFLAPLPSPIVQISGLPLPSVRSLSGTRISTGGNLSSFLFGVLPSAQGSPGNELKSGGQLPGTPLSTSAGADSHKLWPGLGETLNQFDSLGTPSSSPSTNGICKGAPTSQSICSQKLLTVLAGAQNNTNDHAWLHSLNSSEVEKTMELNRCIIKVASLVLECSCFQTNYQLRYLLTFAVMDVLARYAAVAASGPVGSEDQVARAHLILGELHRVLECIDSLFNCPRQRPSPSSSTSPHRSQDPLQPLLPAAQIALDPSTVASDQNYVLEASQNLEYDGGNPRFRMEKDDKIFDPVFLPLKREVLRQFERVRDEINSVLRNI